jgi:acetyl/propionyl-CoA carboxylase alpha subunit
MNARLQVEHPVTEMVTGLDLVELQLRVALGEPLPIAQDDVQSDGHSIEVRAYAEDPEHDFLPQAGRVEHVRWPENSRVDTGIEEGTEVSPHYDPLLAKVIVHAGDRSAALAALEDAVRDTEVLGVRTNLTFLSDVIRDPVVGGAKVSTDWLEEAYADWRPARDDELACAIAAVAETEHVLSAARSNDPWTTFGPWRSGRAGSTRIVLRSSDDERAVAVDGRGPYTVDRWTIERAEGCHAWRVTAPDALHAAAARGDDRWFVWARGAAYEIGIGIAPRRLQGAGPARLDSPLPGQVVAVRVHADQEVAEGDELVVVEAMKMEHAIRAPAAGVVRAVLCAEGDQVERGQALVDFEPDAASP